MARDTLSLLQGTLDILILKALIFGPQHGYWVAHWIRETSGGALEIEEGALYTALHRMEKRKWLQSEWGISDKNRRAKFYALTELGREQLRTEEQAWTQYAAAMFKVLHATEARP